MTHQNKLRRPRWRQIPLVDTEEKANFLELYCLEYNKLFFGFTSYVQGKSLQEFVKKFFPMELGKAKNPEIKVVKHLMYEYTRCSLILDDKN